MTIYIQGTLFICPTLILLSQFKTGTHNYAYKSKQPVFNAVTKLSQ